MIDKEKRNKRQNDWIKETSERINFIMPKGTKDRIKLAADKTGQSSAAFIREAIEEKLFKCGIEKKVAVEDPELTENKNN